LVLLERLPINPLSERGRGLFIVSSMTREFNVTERARRQSRTRRSPREPG